MTANERRLTVRRSIRVPLRFRTTSAGNQVAFTGESLNLSERGICFLTERSFEVGEKLSFSMHVPLEPAGKTNSEIKCTGKVVYSQEGFTASGQTRVGAIIEKAEPPLRGLWTT